MHATLRPHWLVAQVSDINCAALAARGVQAVILDLDNTLTPWRSFDIAPAVMAWMAQVKAAGLRACIVSNAATARRVRPVAEELGVPWITRACKPLPGGFHRAMQLLGSTPETTAMIGDQMFTDILGGNRLGLFTILVEPISPHEAWTTSLLQRPLERLLGRVPREAFPSDGVQGGDERAQPIDQLGTGV
jgi:HAD superfamily phosphatase (TIGR01668 family)